MDGRPGRRFRINVDDISSSSSDEDLGSDPVPLNVIYPEDFSERWGRLEEVVGRCAPLEYTERGFSGGFAFRTERKTKRGFSDSGTMPPRKVILAPQDYPLPPNHAEFKWVDREVIGTRSILNTPSCLSSVRPLILPCPVEKAPGSYVINPCSVNDRTCMAVEQGFYMCDEVITSLGVRLPFTKFEMQLLRELRVAPSQLHPNAWSFARAFQKYCKAKGLIASVRNFLWVFGPFVTVKEAGSAGRIF